MAEFVLKLAFFLFFVSGVPIGVTVKRGNQGFFTGKINDPIFVPTESATIGHVKNNEKNR